jgi:hypothetical protein
MYYYSIREKFKLRHHLELRMLDMSDILAQPPLTSIDAIARQPRPGVMLTLRWLGTMFDWLILGSFMIVPDWLLGNERYQQTIWIWLGLIVLYYPVLEGFWGRTHSCHRDRIISRRCQYSRLE